MKYIYYNAQLDSIVETHSRFSFYPCAHVYEIDNDREIYCKVVRSNLHESMRAMGFTYIGEL